MGGGRSRNFSGWRERALSCRASGLGRWVEDHGGEQGEAGIFNAARKGGLWPGLALPH